MSLAGKVLDQPSRAEHGSRAEDACPCAVQRVVAPAVILPLPRGLLDDLVGHAKVASPALPGELHAIAIGRAGVIAGERAGEGAVVRVVFDDRRIEVAVGARRRGAERQRLAGPAMSDRCAARCHAETAGSRVDRPVKSFLDVAIGGHLHDPRDFPAVLGGDVAGEHRHRLDRVLLEIGREGRRTVLVHRDAVDDEQRLVLGAARVQHAVGFHQPAWLLIHEVENHPPRNGGQVTLQLRGGDAEGDSSPLHVNERQVRSHVDTLLELLSGNETDRTPNAGRADRTSTVSCCGA